MIREITIALCEGVHDTAFLYRILKTKCFKTFNEPLHKLPKVVGDFIINQNKKVEYEKLKIDSLKNEYIPYKIMQKNEKMILLYALGGDKENIKDSKRLTILKHFVNNIKSKIEDKNNFGNSFIPQANTFYNFLFFYDADENKKIKIDTINSYLKDLSIEEALNHNEIKKFDDYAIGAYIFSSESEKGALEDILLNLMIKDNEEVFNKAKEFLTLQDESRFKRLKIDCDKEEIEKREKKQPFYEKKSLIGVVGQLQNSGASNVVTIEHSDYLNYDKITSSKKLQEIAEFLDN